MYRIQQQIWRGFSTVIKKNPFQVLGINNTASDEDIKSAYYSLAKKYHPDIKPQYAQKFKEISQAYNILKDPVKKSEFQSILNKTQKQDNVNQYSKSYYNTNFHYGYTNKYSKQQQNYQKTYESNPFANNYERTFSNQFTREMFRRQNQMQRRKNIRQMNSNVSYVLISIFSIASILVVTEMVLNIYRFNHQQQKRIKKQSRNAYEEDQGYEL